MRKGFFGRKAKQPEPEPEPVKKSLFGRKAPEPKPKPVVAKKSLFGRKAPEPEPVPVAAKKSFFSRKAPESKPEPVVVKKSLFGLKRKAPEPEPVPERVNKSLFSFGKQGAPARAPVEEAPTKRGGLFGGTMKMSKANAPDAGTMKIEKKKAEPVAVRRGINYLVWFSAQVGKRVFTFDAARRLVKSSTTSAADWANLCHPLFRYFFFMVVQNSFCVPVQHTISSDCC